MTGPLIRTHCPDLAVVLNHHRAVRARDYKTDLEYSVDRINASVAGLGIVFDTMGKSIAEAFEVFRGDMAKAYGIAG